ncbi:MAG: hypothetical protein CMH12_00855 [Maritimibacter sp.]|nr:hypothetical protein [Maritimibacter sp.]
MLAVLGFPASAQSFRVESGEHPGYTRLAILFGALPDWQTGRVPGGYEVRTDLPDATYRLQKVFNRIPRTRVRDIRNLPGGGLAIESDCDCHLEVFEYNGNLVIDIRDGPAPEGSAFNQPFPSDEPSRETEVMPPMPPLADPAARVRPELAGFVPDLASPEAFETGRLRTPYAWEDTLSLDLDDVAGNAASDVPQSVDDADGDPEVAGLGMADRLDALQAELISQISRAAGQGVVEPDASQIEAALDRARATAETSPPDEAPPEPAPDPEPAVEPDPEPVGEGLALEDRDNIKIETSVDRGRSGLREVLPLTEEGGHCIADAQLDLPNWGASPESGADLSNYRSRIVGEFDAADADSIAALARNYLFLTFGLEARVLIHAFGTPIEDAEIYESMSHIMDDGFAPPEGPFDDQLSCRNRSALWAALARPHLRPTDRIATPSILAAFSELPVHLRRHLGPYLVERFLEAGDEQAASTVRNAVARAPGDHGDGFRMIEGDIAMGAGDVAEAESHYDDIVASDGPLAPDALVKLIDTQIANDEPVSTADRDNAAAMAFSHRGNPTGSELMRVYLRALAHGGQIPEALTGLEDQGDAFDETLRQDLLLEFLALAASDSPQDQFLRTVLPGPLDLGVDDEADAVRRAIAERLIGLGLTEAARAQMSADLSIPSPEDRVLYARAYLAEQRPDLVFGYLAGLEDTEAAVLRARAHEMAGEYEAAARIYGQIGDAEAQSRALWRAENWDAARELTDGAEQAAAELASTIEPAEDTPAPLPEGMLSNSRSLLDSSRESRRILDDLLSETAPAGG